MPRNTKNVRVGLELDDKFSPQFKKVSAELTREAKKLEAGFKDIVSELKEAKRELAVFNREGKALSSTSRDLKDVARSAAMADKEFRSLGKSAKDLKIVHKETESIRRELRGVTREAGSAGSALKTGIGAFLGAGSFIGLTRLGDGVRDLAGSLVQASGKVQTFQIQLETIFGSAERARLEYKALTEYAATTPFQLDGLVETQLRLANLTNLSNAAISDIERLGNAAAITDQPIQELAVHYGRIIEGLKNNTPIGESTARLNELGVISGQTTRELRKMVEEGTGREGIPKFLKEFDKFDGTVSKLSKTIPGLSSTLKDQFADFFREIGSGGFTSGLQNVLGELVGFYGTNREELAETANFFGEALGGALDELAESIKTGEINEALSGLMDYFKDPENRNAVTAFFSNMVGAIESVVNAIDFLIKGFGLAVDAFNKVSASGAAFRALTSAPSGFNEAFRQRQGGKFGIDLIQQAIGAGRVGLTGSAGSAQLDTLEAVIGSLFSRVEAGRKSGEESIEKQARLDLLTISVELKKAAQALAPGAQKRAAQLSFRAREFATDAGSRLRRGVSGIDGGGVDLGRPTANLDGTGAGGGGTRGKGGDLDLDSLWAELDREFNKDRREVYSAYRNAERARRSAERAREEALAAFGGRFAISQEEQVGRAASGARQGLGAPTAAEAFGFGSAEERAALVDLQIEAEKNAGRLKLEAQQEQQIAELEALEASEKEKQAVREYYANEQAILDEALSRKKEEMTKRDTALATRAVSAQLSGFKDFASGISEILKMGAKESDEMRIAYKAAATSEAVIASYLAGTKVLAQVPFPANIFAMGGVIASGLANVSKIQSQKFEDGGVVGGARGVYATGDRETIRINRGEMVLNAAQQSELYSIAKGEGSGGRGASIVYAPVISEGVNANSLRRALDEDREKFVEVMKDARLLEGEFGIV